MPALLLRFKICLTWIQVWVVRQSVYGFSLPGELSEWLSMFQLFSFDVGGFLFPSWTCVGSLTARLACSGLWPLVLMVAVALALSAREALSKGSLRRAAMSSLEAAIFISSCLLPSVTSSLFLAFQCESIRYDDLASRYSWDATVHSHARVSIGSHG